MKKKKNTNQEDKQVYVKRCTLCGKKFKTCNKNRKVCDVCPYTSSKVKKIKIEQRRNRDGVSYTTKCICCGQEFTSCNITRTKCTSCTCDDLDIPVYEVQRLFSIGNEPDNTMPDSYKVRCYNCSLKKRCTRRSTRLRSVSMCCNGEWVKCSQCIFAPKCDKRNTEKAKECRNGVLANQEPQNNAENANADIPEDMFG